MEKTINLAVILLALSFSSQTLASFKIKKVKDTSQVFNSVPQDGKINFNYKYYKMKDYKKKEIVAIDAAGRDNKVDALVIKTAFIINKPIEMFNKDFFYDIETYRSMMAESEISPVESEDFQLDSIVPTQFFDITSRLTVEHLNSDELDEKDLDENESLSFSGEKAEWANIQLGRNFNRGMDKTKTVLGFYEFSEGKTMVLIRSDLLVRKKLTEAFIIGGIAKKAIVSRVKDELVKMAEYLNDL